MDELIKINSLTGERKSIKISENILAFENRKLDLNEVKEIKYGLEPIRFYKFTVGRNFVIELKNSEGEGDVVITIKYYFGVSKNYFLNVYSKILDEIWKYTGIRLFNEALDKIKVGNTVTVGPCTIFSNGITFKNGFVNWENLIYQKNYNRITLTDKSNHNHWTNLYYLQTYNSDILIGILDWIYKHDGLNELKTIHNNLL